MSRSLSRSKPPRQNSTVSGRILDELKLARRWKFKFCCKQCERTHRQTSSAVTSSLSNRYLLLLIEKPRTSSKFGHKLKNPRKVQYKKKKIRVVYRSPNELGNGVTAGDNVFDSSPPPYNSASAAQDTEFNPAHSTTSRPVSHGEAYNSAPGDDSTAVATTSPEEKTAELAAARAKIAALEAELKEQGLRFRRTTETEAEKRSTDSKGGMGMTTHPPEGIPVQICAALCLAAFFIAWFFF